jgi:hypothetical protein
MALSGLWGSIFSRKQDRSARPFRRIGIAVGSPVPAETAHPEAMRGKVLSLLNAS